VTEVGVLSSMFEFGFIIFMLYICYGTVYF